MLKNCTASAASIANLVGTVRLTGRCAGCNKEFSDRNPAVSGGLVIEAQGSAGYQLCAPCVERRHGDRKFRRRLKQEAYRTIFGAGPDQVGCAA
jgi:hypothetical protein